MIINSMAKNVDKLRIYIKPTCTTCKKAVKKLSEEGKNFESVNYYEQKFTKKKIREILDKIDVEPKELLRKREKTYKELELGKKDLTKQQVVNLLYDNPDLIQRPIIESGGKYYLGRPVDKLDDIV